MAQDFYVSEAAIAYSFLERAGYSDDELYAELGRLLTPGGDESHEETRPDPNPSPDEEDFIRERRQVELAEAAQIETGMLRSLSSATTIQGDDDGSHPDPTHVATGKNFFVEHADKLERLVCANAALRRYVEKERNPLTVGRKLFKLFWKAGKGEPADIQNLDALGLEAEGASDEAVSIMKTALSELAQFIPDAAIDVALPGISSLTLLVMRRGIRTLCARMWSAETA
ncbi:MAG: hypothetical protein ACXIVL_07510 [Oceanicaulis sp.]